MMFNLTRSQLISWLKHPLLSASFLVILGNNLINFLSYLYHVLVGRLLGPVGYSELAAFFSLIVMFSVFPVALSPVVIKYISSAKNEGEIVGLWHWFNRLMMIVGGVVFVIMVLLTGQISKFLQIDNQFNIILVAILCWVILPLTVSRSVLMGLLRFKAYILTNILETSIKLVGGVGLILIGWSVFGALIAIILGVVMSFFLTRWMLDHLNKVKKIPVNNISDIGRYAVPVLIQSLSVTALMSVDVILAKHLFSPFDAGIYAALATMGKVVFYGSGAVSGVMFPIVSSRAARSEPYNSVFWLAVVLTSLMVFGVIVIYGLFPKLMISLLFGAKYLSGSHLLLNFGIYGGLLAMTMLLLNFNMALKRTAGVYLVGIAAIGQVIGIMIFHQDISAVINVSVLMMSLLMIGQIIYSIHASKISQRRNSSL